MLDLDHIVVFTPELDRVAMAYRRLGFTLAPRGTHAGLGTANHTIMLERTYLELLSVVERTAGSARWADVQARGEGLGAVALGARDVRSAHTGLAARGVAIGAPLSLTRQVRVGAESREARFTLAHLEDDASPALPAFLCQHHTRDLVWRPELMSHANGAAHVAGITIAAAAPGDLGAAYERLLGRAFVHPHPGGIALDVRGTRIWILTPDYIAARLGRDVPAGRTPAAIGLSLTVRDLGATRRHLAAREIPFASFGRRSVAVGPTWTAGLHLEFIAA